MRCPKCKSELVIGENRKYETLSNHVSNPNATDYPMRKTFECQNAGKYCPNGFYDEWGDYYSINGFVDKKYLFALDSNSRKSCIDNKVIHPFTSHKSKFFTYLKEVLELHIWEEKDIPQNVLTLCYFFTRAKYRHYKMILTVSIPLKLGIRRYAFEKENRINVIKKRINSYKQHHQFSRL